MAASQLDAQQLVIENQFEQEGEMAAGAYRAFINAWARSMKENGMTGPNMALEDAGKVFAARWVSYRSEGA